MKKYYGLRYLALLALIGLSCSPAAGPAPAPKATTLAPSPAAQAAPTTVTAPTPTAKLADAGPKYGGVIASYIVSDPAHFDFHQAPSINVQEPVRPAYSGLVRYVPSGEDKVEGDLAETWDISPDGTVYTFHLRKGIKFHDGTPLTAEDVRNSMERQRKPPEGVLSVRQEYLMPVSEITAPDENTVKLTLRNAYAPMMPILGMGYWGVYPKHIVEAEKSMKRVILGSGPFKFKSFSPGSKLDLVKNPDYYFKGRPYLDGITFYIIRDPATASAAFRTGRVNLAGRGFAALTGIQADAIKKEQPDIKLFPDPGVMAALLILNLSKPPLNDLRLRQAINLAMDRQAAVKSVTQGHGRPLFYFTLWGWGIPLDELQNLPGFRQPKDADVAQAKKLLMETGVSGLKLTVYAKTTPITQKAAEFLTSQLGNIGISATVKVEEDAVSAARRQRGDFEVYVMGYTNAITDPIYVGSYILPGGGLNYVKYDDEVVTGLWQEQVKMMDATKRRDIFYKIEKRLYEQLPGIPVVGPTDYVGHWPDVMGFSPGVSDFGHFEWEMLWLSK